MRGNLVAWSEQALAFGVRTHSGCGAVEVCGFGVRAEDVGEEEVAYTALQMCQSCLVRLSVEEAILS